MLKAEDRLRTKAQLRDWLGVELQGYPASWQRFLCVGEAGILRRHTILLRKTEYHLNSGHKLAALWYKLRLRRLQTRYCLHIPLNTCARGLRIMHLGPILINSKATVGEDCTLHINTSIVAGGTNDDVPTLGKGVIVGVGAVILGGVQVADYTAIGANAVVNRDATEANTAVAGVPARKISNNGSREWNKKT